MKTGAELIAEERARQVEKEGYDIAHDDSRGEMEMARAAECYLEHYIGRAWVTDIVGNDYARQKVPDDWPWDDKYWKPKDPVRDLIRSGALIAAEIDRLQRTKARP